MIVRLDPAARDDIREATEWYAVRDPKAAKDSFPLWTPR
jgi:plasmid stabilization system protein ParE